MAFNLSPMQVEFGVGETTYKYPWEGDTTVYPDSISTIVGVDDYDDARPFVPYRKEELIEAGVATTVRITIEKGTTKKDLYILCATDLVPDATSAIKTGGAFAATSLFGKSYTWANAPEGAGSDGWTIVNAARVKNQRVKD